MESLEGLVGVPEENSFSIACELREHAVVNFPREKKKPQCANFTSMWNGAQRGADSPGKSKGEGRAGLLTRKRPNV